MRPPDYRPAACCGNCEWTARFGDKCIKHSYINDMLTICADFQMKEVYEEEK